MSTLRDTLTVKIERLAREVARSESHLALSPSGLLDLDVPCDRVWTFYRSGTETLEIMYVTDSEEVQRTAASFIMDALGTQDATKEIDTTGDPSISITHAQLPGIKVMVERSADCHLASVTEKRTIQYCGTLDESQYLSVDYLDPDPN